MEQVQIPVVARPKPLQLVDTRVRVVTKDTLEQFLTDYEQQYGQVAFVVLSMKDYENLALNIADLRRYINQQTEIIIKIAQNCAAERQPVLQSVIVFISVSPFRKSRILFLLARFFLKHVSSDAHNFFFIIS